MRTRITLTAMITVAALTAGACSPSTSPPTAVPTTTAGSPDTMPTHDLTLRVRSPVETPGDTPVRLVIEAIAPDIDMERIPMTDEGNGFWSATTTVPDDGLVRYTYDRWDGEGCCETRLATREDVFTDDPVAYRLLVAEPGLDTVRDVIPQWHDDQTGFQQVEIAGRVTDSASGEPLMDVDVTAGGVHVATRFDGTFTIPGLPPGPQRVVARTATGGHSPAQVEIDLPEGGARGINLAMVPVTFIVRLSDDTPAASIPHVGGNLRGPTVRPTPKATAAEHSLPLTTAARSTWP